MSFDDELEARPLMPEPDIYTEEGIEEFMESDMISDSEEGFMLGYLGAV